MNQISGIVAVGAHIWITNAKSGSTVNGLGVAVNGPGNAVELNGSTGALIRVVDFEPAQLDANSNPLEAANDPLVVGRNLWVSTAEGLAELKTSNGKLKRTVALNVSNDPFVEGSATSGHFIWINADTGIYEINTETGSQVRFIKDKTLGFRHPSLLAVRGTTLWVANGAGSSLDQIDSSTCTLIKTDELAKGRTLASALGMAVDGSDLWVALQNQTMVELNATTGARLAVVAHRGKDEPSSLTANSSTLWACGEGSVIELSASNGKVLRVISLASKGVAYTEDIAVSQGHVWVVAQATNSQDELIELNETTGAVLRILR